MPKIAPTGHNSKSLLHTIERQDFEAILNRFKQPKKRLKSPELAIPSERGKTACNGLKTACNCTHTKKPQKTAQNAEKQAFGVVGNGLSLDTRILCVPPPGISDLRKRAKNRFFSQELARHLTALDSPLNKAYRRTLFDCASLLIQEGQKVTAKYCNSRWCNTCNRIRTAKLIEGYKKPLQAFSDPYFVTLTIPNVKAEDLKGAISLMLLQIKRMWVHKRKRKKQFNGIRKLECTYNAKEDTYHPHLHFIVDGKDAAEWLISQWLQRYPEAYAGAQDYRKADKNSLLELFKYTTKIVSKAKSGFQIYIKPLDTIFQAMAGLRTFQPFGIVKHVKEDIEDVQAITYDIPYYESVVWMWEKNDWISMITGEPLTGYLPSERMIQLVTEKMVT